MSKKFNLKVADNILRIFHIIAILAAIPVLSYLTVTHKEKPEEKSSMVYHVKTGIIKGLNS